MPFDRTGVRTCARTAPLSRRVDNHASDLMRERCRVCGDALRGGSLHVTCSLASP